MKFLDVLGQRLEEWSEERFYLAVLSAMASVVAATVLSFALYLHWNFVMIACDTAGFQSAIVNTLHGNWFRDSAYDGPNLLGQHSFFVVLLLVPIYALFPYVQTLFVLQIVGVYSTVVPLYLVTREIVGQAGTAFLVAAGALASPLLLHMALAPFHVETWFSAAVLWSYYFYRRDRARAFWLSFCFAVSCAEQVAMIYVALGLALVVFEDGVPWRRKYGVFALAGGLAWLVFSFGVLFPLMHRPEQDSVMADHYSQWGVNSTMGLIAAVWGDPFKAVLMWLGPGRWFHLLELVGLPLALAFLSRRSLILLLPFPLYFLMAKLQFYLYFHAYYFQFAFFAGYMGLAIFLARSEVSKRIGQATIAATILGNVLTATVAISTYVIFGANGGEELNGAIHREFDRISRDAAVYSPHRYSAYLSNRDNMVMGDLREDDLDFDAMIEAKAKTTDVHAAQIDYIVCDVDNDQCGWRQDNYDTETSKKRAANIQRLLESGEWKLFWNQSNVIILKRAGE